VVTNFEAGRGAFATDPSQASIPKTLTLHQNRRDCIGLSRRIETCKDETHCANQAKWWIKTLTLLVKRMPASLSLSTVLQGDESFAKSSTFCPSARIRNEQLGEPDLQAGVNNQEQSRAINPRSETMTK